MMYENFKYLCMVINILENYYDEQLLIFLLFTKLYIITRYCTIQTGESIGLFLRKECEILIFHVHLNSLL